MSEPRSSIPERRSNDTRKGHVVKTTVMLVVMGAMYTGLYFLTRGDVVGRMLFWGTAVVCVAIWLGLMIVFQVQARRFRRDCHEGVAALARGDLARARELYWSWSEGTKMPRVEALARYLLAWTLMRQGELAQAIAIAVDVDERQPGALTAMGVYPMNSADIALFHALNGDTAGAARWLMTTEQRAGLLSLPSQGASVVFARAVLDCRNGQIEDAVRLLDERWGECEALMTGGTLRPMRIVRAFAVAATGPRNAGLAEALLVGARPAYPGEYDFLGVAWPEMATFLVSHGLARKPSSAVASTAAGAAAAAGTEGLNDPPGAES